MTQIIQRAALCCKSDFSLFHSLSLQILLSKWVAVNALNMSPTSKERHSIQYWWWIIKVCPDWLMVQKLRSNDLQLITSSGNQPCWSSYFRLFYSLVKHLHINLDAAYTHHMHYLFSFIWTYQAEDDLEYVFSASKPRRSVCSSCKRPSFIPWLQITWWG